jgi:predicted glutamine amidotransferase
MCQLLGMNCNVPTDICFSFTGFRARGGLTDVHRDGWGIAFFENKGVRVFLDHQSSVESPVADLVKNYPIRSKNVISHIRKATQGAVALENTHPFSRELWGQYWIFAHNGNIPVFNPLWDGPYRPVGQTDSEKVFCWMLQEMRREFGDVAPSANEIFKKVTSMSLEIGAKGIFNFLLSNGEFLIAHCSTQLTHIQRKAPFSVASLKDQDMTINFNSVTTANDRVAVIATLPLTSEKWTDFEPGTIWMFKEGEIVAQSTTVRGVKSDSGQA